MGAPRIDFPDAATLRPETQQALSQLAPLNLLKMMAHAASLVLGYGQMGAGILRHGVLPADLRELAILRVGHLTASDYEKHQHVPLARHVGVSPAKIAAAAVGSGDPAYSKEESAALRFVEETLAHVRVRDAAFAEARAFFNDAELAELSLIAGYYFMTAAFLKTFDVPVEDVSPLVAAL